MPAAAVIPAPIAYIKVVAVKKLVVGFVVGVTGLSLCVSVCVISVHPWVESVWHSVVVQGIPIFYCEKN